MNRHTETWRASGRALIALALLPASLRPPWADEDKDARTLSAAIGPALALGEAALFVSGPHGNTEAREGAKALAAIGLLTSLLKATVRERRLNDGPRTSFPSGHSSAAFAMATVIGDYHLRHRGPAYGLAAGSAWSRVDLQAHYFHDVLAGALLGHFVADRYVRKHPCAKPQRSRSGRALVSALASDRLFPGRPA